jgi:hypothetical protein
MTLTIRSLTANNRENDYWRSYKHIVIIVGKMTMLLAVLVTESA